MTIQLASTNQSAHDALREALPELHRELQAAGLPDSGLSLQLSDQGTGGSAGSAGHSHAEPRRTTSDSHPGAADTPAVRTENRPRPADSGLDRWL
jgi:flagellar hook-length control protein FliK